MSSQLMSNSCRQESLRLSLGVGAFYLYLKRSLSNSIPQGMKSIRREWKCGSPEEQSGFFEQASSSKTGVAPSSHTVIPSPFPYPPHPLNSNHSVKNGKRMRGMGCRFAGENS
ncbi:hypothetical protein CDAR_60131 [Caerostris darwini]|uniref:Uncharacterized protein n=1 Tax=Caerostris darwini TaxID=1538125 RepID=A0AAV4QKP3_9ARAC|nr:hypothetical protein CDAR_60131 [Caerostris darwini]